MDTTTQTRARLVYGVAFGLLLVWVGSIWAAPWLLCSGHPWLALLLYRGFSLVCHQRPERSFHWCGSPLTVCVRCTGIYAGALLGLLIYPWWRSLAAQALPARRYLWGALLVLLLDWALGVTGLIRNNAPSRFATGLFLGAISVFYLFPVLLWGAKPFLLHKLKT